MAYFISELKSAGEGSPGDATPAPSLSSPAVPSPWSSPRKVESPHPVRDEYQCCKTVVMPGASCLFVTFDPRCATQYEYDKVRHLASLTFTEYLLVCLHKKRFCKEKDHWFSKRCEAGFEGKESDFTEAQTLQPQPQITVKLVLADRRAGCLSLISTIHNGSMDFSSAFELAKFHNN